MTLARLQPWLARAQREQFALGAFNANTLEQVQAIVEAAQQESAPVIIQISHRALQHLGSGNTILGLRYVAAIGKEAAQSVSVPVVLHLDHGSESEVMQAIALGFTSVMFDGGTLGFERYTELARGLCDLAHSAGVSMEGEVGQVPRSTGAGTAMKPGELTTAQDAVAFLARVPVDALAIAIGSVHAVKEKTVSLDLERLDDIHARVAVPLVLHGSSGVRDEHITAAIARGICKVNIATQLSQAFSGAVRAQLAENPGQVDPRPYLGVARQAMKDRVRERIHHVGTSGKA